MTQQMDRRQRVRKLATGIESFDLIAEGGLPQNRTTLLSGTAGSGKTVFAMQFLAAGIAAGENGVFVTFEEPPLDVRQNMRSFGWNLEQWEQEGKLALVDASPDPEVEIVETGSFELGALLARVENAVRKVEAKRVSVRFARRDVQPILRSVDRAPRALEWAHVEDDSFVVESASSIAAAVARLGTAPSTWSSWTQGWLRPRRSSSHDCWTREQVHGEPPVPCRLAIRGGV